MRSRLPLPTLPKISSSRDQVFVKFSCNDGGDVGNDDANDVVKIMMNTNGNDWWWGRQGQESQFGVQMYFPSLLIIFPKSETGNSSFTKWSKYNMFPSTGVNPDRQIWDWCHLCLYQVMMIMMIMVMVVTNMLIMEIEMMTKMTLFDFFLFVFKVL